MSCQDVGDELVLGPYAVTDKTVYGIGEPITVTVGSDTPVIWVTDCLGGPSFYLDFFWTLDWTEWSDHVTPCLESSAPQRGHSIGPENVYVQSIVPPTNYPGTYRLRIPYRSRLYRTEGEEVVTNTFIIEE